MRFAKYHGLGNDFVIVDARSGDAVGVAERSDQQIGSWAERLCDRHRGIGADGVLLLRGAAGADFRMVIYNADGSLAGMCGNGLRCLLAYMWDEGLDEAHAMAGPQGLKIVVGERLYTGWRLSEQRFGVDMGVALQVHDTLPQQTAGTPTTTLAVDGHGHDFVGVPVWLGNPHFVHFVEQGPSPVDLYAMAETLGATLSNHKAFPDRANISFVRPAAESASGSAATFEAVVYERGVGITQACGSGACAVGLAAVKLHRASANEPIDVRLPGGTLSITVDSAERIRMEGPAVRVFVGETAVTA